MFYENFSQVPWHPTLCQGDMVANLPLNGLGFYLSFLPAHDFLLHLLPTDAENNLFSGKPEMRFLMI
jgi:hypothetical protein